MVFLVDTRNGHIYDSKEHYPLSLTEQWLILCAGGGSKSNITEVIEIVYVHQSGGCRKL